MGTVVEGKIAKFSGPVVYEATTTQPEAIAVCVTIIDNHQRTEDGYTDTGFDRLRGPILRLHGHARAGHLRQGRPGQRQRPQPAH